MTASEPSLHPSPGLVRDGELIGVLRSLRAQAALFAVVYFAFARGGLVFAVQPEAITLVWPASGLYLAVLLVSERRRWPAFVAAAFVADVAANLVAGNGLISFGIATVDAAEGLVAALAVAWVAGRRFALTRVREVVALALAGVGAANAVTTFFGAMLLALGSGAPLWQSWLLWWTADGIGMLAVAPVIWTVLTATPVLPDRRRLMERVLLFGGLALSAVVVFSVEPHTGGVANVLPYALPVPFLLLLAWRSGPAAAAGGSLLLCAAAALFTVHHRGPFAAANVSQTEQLLSLQLFLGLTVITALVLAAAVTERRGAVEELVRERRLLRQLLRRNESILNAAGEGIYGIDRDGRTTFVNAAAARMTGYATGELAGDPTCLACSVTRPPTASGIRAKECAMLASLADGSVHHSRDDDVYWRKDGTSFPVEFTSTPIVEDGEIAGAVVVFRDISERQEVERVREQFASVVSHELRTPLTSIRGSLGLLESGVLGALPDKGRRMIEIAVENTDRLVRLINDILDLERIESDATQLRQECCDAAQLIARATESVLAVAVEADVTLAVDAEPVSLQGDPDRLIQTLTNLVGNAVKFAPAGSTVEVRSRRRDDQALFEVSDRGRGIPVDQLESIFGRFQQVDSSDSRQSGGTGLGLAICRSIVERHGGGIWARSVLGEGSTFSFVVPALAEDADDVSTPRVDGTDGPAILVCDDDAGVREVLGTLLEEHGYRVIAARSGEAAIERALTERPDAILLDLLMPGMSGWETMAVLREHPQTAGIPIVILSVLPRSEGQLAATGADWIEKPADDTVLFSALERAVEGSRRGSLRVLLVEDDPDLAEVLSAVFDRHGVASFAARNGGEAIKLCQEVLPDLLVLDVGLPDLDGFEVVDWLRRHERLKTLPMVVYTARELDDADRERLMLGSITEFLMKSQISALDFERRIVTLLAKLTTTAAERGHEPAAHPAHR